jgi:hypothetical protein
MWGAGKCVIGRKGRARARVRVCGAGGEREREEEEEREGSVLRAQTGALVCDSGSRKGAREEVYCRLMSVEKGKEWSGLGARARMKERRWRRRRAARALAPSPLGGCEADDEAPSV